MLLFCKKKINSKGRKGPNSEDVISFFSFLECFKDWCVTAGTSEPEGGDGDWTCLPASHPDMSKLVQAMCEFHLGKERIALVSMDLS